MSDEWCVMNDEWWVISNEWWVMNDEWWVISDEWWKFENCCDYTTTLSLWCPHSTPCCSEKIFVVTLAVRSLLCRLLKDFVDCRCSRLWICQNFWKSYDSQQMDDGEYGRCKIFVQHGTYVCNMKHVHPNMLYDTVSYRMPHSPSLSSKTVQYRFMTIKRWG